MRLKIVQVGEPVLRQPARPLTYDEICSASIQQLIELMRETMYDAPGVGLAAPQVGLALQLAVIEDKPEYTANSPADRLKERERSPVPFHVIINPRLTLHDDESVNFYEGCLSFPGYVAKVQRARRVTVECLNHSGEPQVIEASGWYARILQHEIDHLNGTIYVDRMDPRTLASVENLNRFHGGLFERKP
jgi:peptide deformylase